ncbi:protease modulator HflC [Govanella unica]|uniref:Protein HflC n=1 Tax=Govanella unica TaxID=2975056 RepID=A0A9X3Z711_9PROT|nr:protease modulator HflC [Govania unica]MDA5193489.1 protease modulator HflC [Govania unica]
MTSNRLTVLIIGLFLLVILATSSTFQVKETQQALVIEFGKPQRTVTEAGLNFKLPWQSVVILDRRVLPLELAQKEVITADQKRVIVDAYARFRIENPLLLYQAVSNEEGAADRLETIVNSVLRRVMGSVPFTAMLSEDRTKLLSAILDASNAQAKGLGIQVIDVRIKRSDLPEANSEAIFKRMRAEREREAREARATGAELAQGIRSRADKERTVLIADAQREAQIIRGKGDGDAARVFAEAVGRDPDFFAFYRSMQAYKEAMSPEDTTLVLSPDSEFFRFFGSLQGKR